MTRDLTGKILLTTPRMQMVEVLAWAPLLDMALVAKLDMEGGQTGRSAILNTSRMVSA